MLAVLIDLSLNASTVVALITLAGTIMSSFIALAAAVFASRANKAVNGRGAGEPVIYDMVKETRDKVVLLQAWKDDYNGGPLDTGDKVDAFVSKVEKINDTCESLGPKFEHLGKEIRKYGCPVKLGEVKECVNPEQA
jgi:hypothetical protein